MSVCVGGECLSVLMLVQAHTHTHTYIHTPPHYTTSHHITCTHTHIHTPLYPLHAHITHTHIYTHPHKPPYTYIYNNTVHHQNSFTKSNKHDMHPTSGVELNGGSLEYEAVTQPLRHTCCPSPRLYIFLY